MGAVFRFFLFSGMVVMVMVMAIACMVPATAVPTPVPELTSMSEVLEGFSDADMDGMMDYLYIVARENMLLTSDEELYACNTHAQAGWPWKEDEAVMSFDDVRYHRSIQTWGVGSLVDRQAVGIAAMLELGPSTRVKYCTGLLELKE